MVKPMTVEELLRHISALKDFAVRVGRNPVLEDELAQMIQKTSSSEPA